MEILPGIHQLRASMSAVFPSGWSVITIVQGERLAVVDTGMPGSTEELILPYLGQLNRSPRDVAAIVNTHAHLDHCSSNKALKEQSGAPIAIHEAEAAVFDRVIPWLGIDVKPGPADRRLKAGDVIDLGGLRMEVIHLPGHTPGSCGFYLPESGTLISGDALQGLGSAFQHLPFYVDPDAYAASVEKALSLPLENLITAHAFSPSVDYVLHGAEARRFLEVSREFVLAFDEVLLGAMKSIARPVSAEALTDYVCRQIGSGGATELATATVMLHLERLVPRGVVAVEAGEETEVYRLAF